MFLVALVCLSVCLFVDNITQQVMNGPDWDEVLWRSPGYYSEELIKFCW